MYAFYLQAATSIRSMERERDALTNDLDAMQDELNSKEQAYEQVLVRLSTCETKVS